MLLRLRLGNFCPGEAVLLQVVTFLLCQLKVSEPVFSFVCTCFCVQFVQNLAVSLNQSCERLASQFGVNIDLANLFSHISKGVPPNAIAEAVSKVGYRFYAIHG